MFYLDVVQFTTWNVSEHSRITLATWQNPLLLGPSTSSRKCQLMEKPSSSPKKPYLPVSVESASLHVKSTGSIGAFLAPPNSNGWNLSQSTPTLPQIHADSPKCCNLIGIRVATDSCEIRALPQEPTKEGETEGCRKTVKNFYQFVRVQII